MLKLLIAEDELKELEWLSTYIRAQHGNRLTIVGECSDGVTALRNAQETKPDIVFLDIQMPLMDGIEVAKFSVEYVGGLDVIDKDTFKKVRAGESAKITSDYFYPANEGTITVFLDGMNVFSLKMDDTTTLYSSPSFKMLGIRDSYYNIAMYRGKYNSMQIQYNAENLDEGYHTIKFEHLVGVNIHKSVETIFQTYKETNPTIINSNSVIPANNVFIR